MSYTPRQGVTPPKEIWEYVDRYLSRRVNVLYENIELSRIKYSGTKIAVYGQAYYARMRGSGRGVLVVRRPGKTYKPINYGTESVLVSPTAGSVGNMKDVDDITTYAYWSVPASTAETNIVTWDLGSAIPRFIRVRMVKSGAYVGVKLKGSYDGVTWTDVVVVDGTSSASTEFNGWTYGDYRYYALAYWNTATGSRDVYVYTIEFYDTQPLPYTDKIVLNDIDYDGNVEVMLGHDGSASVYALLVEYLGELL